MSLVNFNGALSFEGYYRKFSDLTCDSAFLSFLCRNPNIRNHFYYNS